MKSSIFITIAFCAGMIAGYYSMIPFMLEVESVSLGVLYILMFAVGISVGSDNQVAGIFRQFRVSMLLLPAGVVFGTLTGVAVVSFFLGNVSLRDACAVGSGFGYYSLSSVIITRISGEVLGVTALLSNIMRELITLLFAPLFVRFFGPFASIASGGATAMDTTLPVIIRYSGKQYTVLSIFSGTVLSILVPVLVPLFPAGGG